MSANNSHVLIKVHPLVGPGVNNTPYIAVSRVTQPGTQYFDGPTGTPLAGPAVWGDKRLDNNNPYHTAQYHNNQVSYHGIPRGNFQGFFFR